MPNETDWILLHETLKKYDKAIFETWGKINEKKCR